MQGSRDLNNLDAFEVPTFLIWNMSDYFNVEAHFIDSNGKLGFPFLCAKKVLNISHGNIKVLK